MGGTKTSKGGFTSGDSHRKDFRVVTLAGTDVGVMAVAVGPDCATVNQLFLLPGYQGRSLGVRTGETETHDLMEWTP